MNRFYLRAIIACGLSGFLLAGGWLTIVGLALGANQAAVVNVAEYVADPEAETFHDPQAHCLYVGTGKPLMHIHGQDAAERFGKPCPYCLKELSRRQALAARQP